MHDTQFTIGQNSEVTVHGVGSGIIDCGFSRAERLKSETEISTLFRDGKKGFVYPFKYLVIKTDRHKVSNILISVPKRNFKHAVDRNRVKRLVREAYRLNKEQVACEGLSIGFVYIAKNIVEYGVIESAVKAIINQVVDGKLWIRN